MATMIEQQPGRPRDDVFLGAALRFVKDDYYYFDPFYKVPKYNRITRAADTGVIITEWNCEGIGPQVDKYDDIEGLALKLLAARTREIHSKT